MHVVNVAVDDTVFESSAFEMAIQDATPDIAANLTQLAAVGGICNSAMFGTQTSEGSQKSIVGDATGTASSSTVPSQMSLPKVQTLPS